MPLDKDDLSQLKGLGSWRTLQAVNLKYKCL